jgi:hypothetical protein
VPKVSREAVSPPTQPGSRWRRRSTDTHGSALRWRRKCNRRTRRRLRNRRSHRWASSSHPRSRPAWPQTQPPPSPPPRSSIHVDTLFDSCSEGPNSAVHPVRTAPASPFPGRGRTPRSIQAVVLVPGDEALRLADCERSTLPAELDGRRAHHARNAKTQRGGVRTGAVRSEDRAEPSPDRRRPVYARSSAVVRRRHRLRARDPTVGWIRRALRPRRGRASAPERPALVCGKYNHRATVAATSQMRPEEGWPKALRPAYPGNDS